MELRSPSPSTLSSIDLCTAKLEDYQSQNASVEYLVQIPETTCQDDQRRPVKGILQKVKEHISVAPIFARLKTTPHNAGLGIVHRLVESIKPQPKLDFDGYQQQFPPKSFPSPKQTWYNIPTKDDGSHSWPFSETWPPEFFVDLRCHVPLFGTMFLAVTLPILLVQCFAYPATQQIGNRPGYDCMHSGEFSLKGIDVTFGQLTYAEAKAIDLFWNMLVGRGLQSFLIFISCKVFYSVLMFMAERHPVNYELFMAMSMTPTASNGIGPMLRSIIINSDVKSRAMLLWLLGTTVYIALSPTFIDALSGYRAIEVTMKPMEESLTFQGQRGLENWLISPPTSTDNLSKLQLPNGTALDVSSGFTSSTFQHLQRNNPPPYLAIDENGQWYNRTAHFTLTSNATTIYFNGTYRAQNISDVFSASCFNSTTSVLFLSADHYSFFQPGQLEMYDDPSCENWFPLAPKISYAHGIWNETYLRDADNYTCSSKDVYTWGFSYELLLIYFCISGTWILGTWVLYVYSSVHSETIQKGRGFGPWRAVVDLGDALRETLNGVDVCAYSDDELRRNIRGRNWVTYRHVDREDSRSSFGLKEVEVGEGEEGRLRLGWGREYG
ncbi:uncharacterized protein PAC_05956 [Phialocephala subalpina]|uniref:Uncharacterized protein n=1 Tax=Phialocephala subalpina TaxID=576137 RepID=A0A1L7WTF6_9HELO|nr:uncharacterized protein PAC_05956 [Phialocephala subalpina]